jgi:3-phenylpropionate/cinnamic acid dioxygenase small subunit
MSNVAPTAYEAGLLQLLLQREVEAFYTLEAELLDERRFTEWLELFADDARYFMPIARSRRPSTRASAPMRTGSTRARTT